MTFDSTFHGVSLIFQVFLLDLILSGDNAVVIALSCRALPPRQLNQALLLATGAAIGLRVLLTTVVSMLLKVPMLKLIGAVLLIVIGIRLLIEEERGARAAQQEPSSGLWGAVMTVILADVVMSLDNVVALSAVTQGNLLYLVIGLVLSVLLLMFSSKLMINLLHRYPILIPAAGALLGYIAGDIAVSDPAIADWVNTQSPALTGLVPLLCAVLVVAESRIIERRRHELPRPAFLNTSTRRMPPAAALISVDAGTAAISAQPVGAAGVAAISARPADPGTTAFSAHPADAGAAAISARPTDAGVAAISARPTDAGTAAVSAHPANIAARAQSPSENRTERPPEQAPDSIAAPMEQPENVPPANRFGIAKLIGNPFIQITVSTVLALCCIVLLPRAVDIIILIGIIALMLFKIF
ncbi:MAG: YjbE family putative metal transport protein [Steroidobacteraceae bacterium]|jgi:YjbE family integral membrane protein